ncbi:MAG: DUF2997 domain-containing protein [Opitutaceae bacterium]
MKTIIIECDLETGATKIEAHGFQGKQCEVATRPFEEVLGMVDKRVAKREVVKREQPQFIRARE